KSQTLSRGEISQRAADTIARKTFAEMVAGTEDVTSIANYVSFVPTDGKFTLAGNYFFKTTNDTKKARKHEYFALGFTGAGSIVGGTVASLFEKGKLTTGTDLGIRLSWRMNVPNIGSINSEDQVVAEKRTALDFKRDQKIDSINNAISLLPIQLQQAGLAIQEAQRKVKLVEKDVQAVADLEKNCKDNTCKLKYTDSLITLKTKVFKESQRIQTLKKDSTALDGFYQATLIAKTPYNDLTAIQRDYIRRYRLTKDFSYQDTLRNQVIKEYEAKVVEAELSRPVQGLNMSWLSLISNWNRLGFRTYTPSVVYDNQLVKHNFDGYTIGLQGNFYHFSKLMQKATLFNIALLHKRTNNLSDLTSSKLVDETSVMNGSTLRKASTEYNVYTDPVEVYSTWQLPLNYYSFFGKNLNLGWHAYGLMDWRNTGKNIYDIGAGFIFGLNSAGVKRLFNIEVFATYKDINRKLVEEDVTRWQQLQLGVSVAIPFMIFKN
ncbi:MAG TPA: hypothetical protein VGC08_07430, partial [Pedobacter sp.]